MRFIKSFLILWMTLFTSSQVMAQDQFADYPVYKGSDLGVYYSAKRTIFKVWSPKATAVKLRLYSTGDSGNPILSIDMRQQINGSWQAGINRDVKNKYYTFQVYQDGKWLLESPDIYARAVGVNGKRGMVVDLKATDPANWTKDVKPAVKNFGDIIIYELHIRDLSMDQNSGITHKGKFLGLAETGTKSPDGESTGLDHIRALGVTHIHLLPCFDFNSVDESKPLQSAYNWGYDPQNYNVPEGSYSTNPFDGNVRISEFKQMIKALHDNGLRVILDVVYNHTSDALHSNFNQFAPGYFYRHDVHGNNSNGTGCGNETASERPMMRKFMIESITYWAKEYHIDGFRFDLMGIHDIETMNDIRTAVDKIDPSIFIYGEGWTAGDSPLAADLQAVKKNTIKLKNVAAFSDDIRDGIKGSFSNHTSRGFASGAPGNKESVKFGIVGATAHPQVDYTHVNYSKLPWAASPFQSINYVSCHDDHTLYDKLKLSNPNSPESEIIKMNNLSNAIVLTSQGVPFLHSGAEMLRTKQGISNSYNLPDSINQLDWPNKKKYKDVFNYYKGLIALRKDHPAFRMPSTEMIIRHLHFLQTDDPLLIVYQLKDHANSDPWNDILVIFNGDARSKTIAIPEGSWQIVANGNEINEAGLEKVQHEVSVGGISACILKR